MRALSLRVRLNLKETAKHPESSPGLLAALDFLTFHFPFFSFISLFFFLRFYLFNHERHTEAETRQREKQAPCGDPDAGLDPGTLGSRFEPKADAQPLIPLSCPSFPFLDAHPHDAQDYLELASLLVSSWKGNGTWQLAKDKHLGARLSGFKSNLCAHCVTWDKLCRCLSCPICKIAIIIVPTSTVLARTVSAGASAPFP